MDIVRKKMTEQINMIKASAMARQRGYILNTEDLFLYIEMQHQKLNKIFVLQIYFDEYPGRAPSYIFVDPADKKDKPDWWPPNVKHSEGKICIPGTREFHEIIHKNDTKHKPWSSTNYPLLYTLREIDREMHK